MASEDDMGRARAALDPCEEADCEICAREIKNVATALQQAREQGAREAWREVLEIIKRTDFARELPADELDVVTAAVNSAPPIVRAAFNTVLSVTVAATEALRSAGKGARDGE